MIESFVGKGGVGKTTLASAHALRCSEIGRTALVSTDFMPSLRYIFPDKIKNLDVLEISEKEIADKWVETYGDEVYSILSNFIDTDRSIIEHIAYAPGVAEEFMIARIVEMDRSSEYDFIIWDTPASSSTMHLLVVENEFYDHIDRDIRFYLRMRDTFKTSKTLKILEEWKTLANDVWDNLRKSKFYLVHTGDELTIIQGGEIKKEFQKLGLKIEREIHNRLESAGKKCRENEITVPEYTGSAREIVDGISEYLRSVNL